MSPRFRSAATIIVIVLIAALVGGVIGYAAVEIRAGKVAREQRDNAMTQTAQALDKLDSALAENRRIRRDAATERHAFQRHIRRMDGRVNSLLDETELLQARVETLSGQVRDLGGEPSPPPEGLENSEDVESSSGQSGSQSGGSGPQDNNTTTQPAPDSPDSPSQPGNSPDHSNRKPDAGPPDHAKGKQPN